MTLPDTTPDVGAMVWKPIETAPRAGKVILVFARGWEGPLVMNPAGLSADDWTDGPTHWLSLDELPPLPPPPEAP
jgi:hypothetical protein